jgi:hypothetical protein
MHGGDGVQRCVRFSENDDFASLKKVVGLMKGELKGKLVRKKLQGVTRGKFLGRTLGWRIGEWHLTKAEQSRESCEEHRKEKEVVMERRVMGGKQDEEIVGGEGLLLVRNGTAVELVHACERTGYEGGIVSGMHMREMGLQGVTDAG